MSDELVRALQQIQQQADAVRRLIVDAQTVVPARAEGDDASGGLSLIVGPDGLPESLRVAADWRDRLAPGHFADAVLEAFAAASENRMAVWMRPWRPATGKPGSNAYDGASTVHTRPVQPRQATCRGSHKDRPAYDLVTYLAWLRR